MFTGDLEREIISNPFFFGKEMHYLRAQIARISHSTAICPDGSKKLSEESERDIVDNDPEEGELILPNTSEMGSLDKWVHENASILGCNRTTHLDPPEEAPEDAPEDWDPEVARKEIEDADPFEPRLKPISKDCNLKMSVKTVKQPVWVVRLMGDSTEFKDEMSGNNPKAPTVCYGCVVVRSLVWPGSFTFY